MEIDEPNFCHYRKSSGGSVELKLQRNQPLLLRNASSRRILSFVFAHFSSGAKLMKAGKVISSGIGATLNNPSHRTYAKRAYADGLYRSMHKADENFCDK